MQVSLNAISSTWRWTMFVFTDEEGAKQLKVECHFGKRKMLAVLRTTTSHVEVSPFLHMLLWLCLGGGGGAKASWRDLTPFGVMTKRTATLASAGDAQEIH